MIPEETVAATTSEKPHREKRQMQNVAPRCPCSDPNFSVLLSLGRGHSGVGHRLSLDQYAIPTGVNCKSGRRSWRLW